MSQPTTPDDPRLSAIGNSAIDARRCDRESMDPEARREFDASVLEQADTLQDAYETGIAIERERVRLSAYTSPDVPPSSEGSPESVEWMPTDPQSEQATRGPLPGDPLKACFELAARAADSLAALGRPTGAEALRVALQRIEAMTVDRAALIKLHRELKRHLLANRNVFDDADRVYVEWDDVDRRTVACLAAALGLGD